MRIRALGIALWTASVPAPAAAVWWFDRRVTTFPSPGAQLWDQGGRAATATTAVGAHAAALAALGTTALRRHMAVKA